jgi:voltage-gated potassium channel
MKAFASQLLGMVRQRRQKRNISLLLRFLAVLVAMVVAYSIAFHYVMAYEGRSYSWVTGFYWTLTVMSTLGFGDITFESDLGRLFSIVVLLSGTVFLLVLLPFTFIQFFYAPWMEAQAAARTPRQLPPDTRGHVILTSHDAVTAALIRKLQDFEYDYVLIVPDLPEAQRLADLGFRVLLGDIDDPDTYTRARASQASLLATTLADPVNTNVVFTVREVAPDLPIVATASDGASIKILELAGATSVLLLGETMGQSLARCTVGGDAVTHVVGNVDELLIAEANTARTPLVGKTLRENRLADLGVNVIGIWERGTFVHAHPDTVVGPNTILVLVGSAAQLENYDEHFAIYNVSTDPVLVLGGGRIGRAAAHALAERGFDWRIVEQRPERASDPARTIIGNAADLSVLESAGIRKAPAVIITTHDDNTNLYLTILCRQLRPDIQIITRSTLDRNVGTQHRAGADFVLSYASIGAGAMFNLLKKSRVVTVAEGLEVFRVPVPAALAGVPIAQSGVREKTGCTIVAVRGDNGMEINPPAQAVLLPDHEMVLVGDAASRAAFFETYTR